MGNEEAITLKEIVGKLNQLVDSSNTKKSEDEARHAEVIEKMDVVTKSNNIIKKDVDTLKTNQQLQHTNVQGIRREVIRNKNFIEATRRELVANFKEMEQERKNCILWDRDVKGLKEYTHLQTEELRITEYAYDLILEFMTTFDRRDFKAKRLNQNDEDKQKGFFRLLITFNNVAAAEIFRDRAVQGTTKHPKILKIRSGLTKLERSLMYETKTLVDQLNKNNKTPHDFVYARKFMFKVCKVDPNDHNKIKEVLRDSNPSSNYRRIIMGAEAPLLPFEAGERPQAVTSGAIKRKASQENEGAPGLKNPKNQDPIMIDVTKPPPPLPQAGTSAAAIAAFRTPPPMTASASTTAAAPPLSPLVPHGRAPDLTTIDISDDDDEEVPKREPRKVTEVTIGGGKKITIPGSDPTTKISSTDFRDLNKDEIKIRSNQQARLIAAQAKQIADLMKKNQDLLVLSQSGPSDQEEPMEESDKVAEEINANDENKDDDTNGVNGALVTAAGGGAASSSVIKAAKLSVPPRT